MSRPGTHWGERIYGVFVALYLRDFRVRYGPAMRSALRELLEDPEMPAWRIWLSVLHDVRGSFLHEHLANVRRGISMTRGRLLPGALVRSGLAEVRTHRTGIVAGLARVAMLTVLIGTPVATGAVGYYLGRSQVSPVKSSCESAFDCAQPTSFGVFMTFETLCGTSRPRPDGVFWWNTRQPCP